MASPKPEASAVPSEYGQVDRHLRQLERVRRALEAHESGCPGCRATSIAYQDHLDEQRDVATRRWDCANCKYSNEMAGLPIARWPEELRDRWYKKAAEQRAKEALIRCPDCGNETIEADEAGVTHFGTSSHVWLSCKKAPYCTFDRRKVERSLLGTARSSVKYVAMVAVVASGALTAWAVGVVQLGKSEAMGPVSSVVAPLEDRNVGAAAALDGPVKPAPASATATALADAPAFPTAAGPVRVQIIQSEHLTYETKISDALKARLTEKLRDHVIFEGDVHGFPANFLQTEAQKAQWRAEIARVADRHAHGIELDYIVTIGSLATRAVKNFGADKLFRRHARRDRGVIGIGLTDPIQLGFVVGESPGGASGHAAVQYGSGAPDWGRRVSDLFLNADDPRSSRPIFIYDGEYPQDVWVAKALALSPLVEDRIRIQHIPERALRVSDLAGDGTVYFAWYALDALVEKDLAQLREKTIVPSTFNEVNLATFGVVVSVKDQEVGQAGADIIATAVLEGKPLHEFDVAKPSFYTWIDCKVVKSRMMRLSSTLRWDSRIILRPEDDDSCLPASARRRP